MHWEGVRATSSGTRFFWIVRSKAALAAILAAALTLGALPAGARTHDGPKLGRYIVVLKSSAPRANAVAAAQSARFDEHVLHVYTHVLKGYAALVPIGRLAALKADPNVAFVEPDVQMHEAAQTVPWGISRVGSDLSWTKAGDSAGEVHGVNVYILDRGIQLDHPDLNVIQRVPIVPVPTNLSDPTYPYTSCAGHATHVAGIASARDNASQVVGVAPGAPLTDVAVLDCAGHGWASGVIKGLDWVAANATKPAVANMSMAGPRVQALEDAMTRTVNSGVVITVSAGNSGADACNYSPAHAGLADGVIDVAATDSSNGETSWSNYGSCVDLWAPGQSILSTWPGSGTATMDGTSMASPHVAGAAALYLALHKNATPAAVEAALKLSAFVPGTLSKDGRPVQLVNASSFTAPVAAVSSRGLTFTATVGATSSEETVTVSNNGTSDLTFASIGLGGANPGDFVVSTNTCSGAMLAAGSSCNIGIKFAPTVSGTRNAALLIADNDPDGSLTVWLVGNGTGPDISLAPTGISFGSVGIGSTSGANAVTVMNTGSSALSFAGIGLGGTNPNDFPISANSCSGTVLVPGASCTVWVPFTPILGGSRSALLLFADNAPEGGGLQSVPLDGTGVAPQPSFSPSSLAFGTAPVGTGTNPQTVTVTNIGEATLTFTGVGLGGTNPTDFAITSNTCGNASLIPNATCTVGVRFTPRASGTRSAFLRFRDNAPDSGGLQQIPLGGSGTAPVVAPSPSSLTFSTNLGSASASERVTVTNTGNSSLTFTGVGLIGNNASDFQITGNTCGGATIEPTASCTVDVRFVPRAAGSRTGALAFADNAVDSPQSVPLSGNATAPVASPSPTSLSFGDVQQGHWSNSQTVTVTNAGNGPLIITGVGFGGSNASDFALSSNACGGTTLPPTASCTVSVRFRPRASGQRIATLRFADNAADSPQSVSLSGNGT